MFGKITIRRVSDGQLIHSFTAHKDWVFSVSFSPDGTLLASGGADESVKLWRASDGKLARALKTRANRVQSVSFSPDGALLASGGSGRYR
jgi:WD40 repeat protein